MNIHRMVDIDVRVGDGRSLHIQEEVEFQVTGEEAFRAIMNGAFFDHDSPESRLKGTLNAFAELIKAIPDATIQALSPEARRIIVGFLEGSAKRFYEQPQADQTIQAI